MSTGSASQTPSYTTWDPNALADGKRTNESPAPKEQPPSDNMKVKKEAYAPQTKKKAKEKKWTGHKSASLTSKYNLEFDHANVRTPSV
jgi:hypothetical protein